MRSESTRRLYKAYQSDKYVADIRRRIEEYMFSYASPAIVYKDWELQPQEMPDIIKMYQRMIKDHIATEYPLLVSNENKSDLVMAMGWALIAANNRKILSTKAKTNLTVFQCIDYRFDLFPVYLKYRLDNTNYTRMSPMEIYMKIGMLFNYPEPPMEFDEWLYTNGYEFLLTDTEFLNVIHLLDSLK